MKNQTTFFRRLKVAVAIAFFSSFNIVNAQNMGACGTIITQSQIDYLNKKKSERIAFDIGTQKTIQLLEIPVKHHIVRKSDGTGGLSAADLQKGMDDLNLYYKNANIHFFQCSTPQYINDDNLYDFDYSEESLLMDGNDLPNVINIYYINNITQSGTGLCGYAYFPGGPDRIAMANGCVASGGTMVHEMGHYFSLYHTHGKSNFGTTDELVNGANCSNAGDDICDTPADPNLWGYVDANCNYTGTFKDANGQAYLPQTHNVMSYSNHTCRDHLTTGQYNRIAYSALHDRAYLFNTPITADFKTDKITSCSPGLTVHFTNLSSGANSYLWNFGDGNTSSETNPAHTYNSAGKFTVSMKAIGNGSCGYGNGTKELIKPDLITINNTGGPIPAICIPPIANYGYDGIYNVTLGTLNNNSSAVGYEDYSCAAGTTTLLSGGNVPFSVTTNNYNSTTVRAWIDFNNNGDFEDNESVFYSYAKVQNHSGFIRIPASAVKNQFLRMRVINKYIYSGAPTSCDAYTNGDAEDYSVKIVDNTLAPVAYFSNDTIIANGAPFMMRDLSQNVPTSWEWTFEGGSPANATIENPIVTYSANGTYSVTLKVTNAFGTSTITRNVTVTDEFNMCGITNVHKGLHGKLFDSGGQSGNYGSYENCTFLIDNGCAASITLHFTEFNLAAATYGERYGGSSLSIYDGENYSKLLYSGNGSNLPPDLIARSGKMWINFYSAYRTSSGFAAEWNTVISNGPSVSRFEIDNSNPALNVPVAFTDKSENDPRKWSWSFGDGSYSNLQSPSHVYTSPGTYNVKLTASNCTATDSIVKTVTVQGIPAISVLPSSLNVTLQTEQSTNKTLSISNSGQGDLVWNFSHNIIGGNKIFTSNNSTPATNNIYTIQGSKVMKVDAASGAMEKMFDVNGGQYSYPNALAYDGKYFFYTLNSKIVETDEKGNIVAEKEIGRYISTMTYSPGFLWVGNDNKVLKFDIKKAQFVDSITPGQYIGNIAYAEDRQTLFIHSYSNNSISEYTLTGTLIKENYRTNVSGLAYSIADKSVIESSYSTGLSFLNPDNMNLVKNYPGMLLNSIAAQGTYSWLNYITNSGKTVKGSQDNINLQFNSAGMKEGTYTINLGITSNTFSNHDLTIPVTLKVEKALGFTVYFKKPATWSVAKIHIWDAKPVGSIATTTWPGIAMTAAPELGNDWYSFKFTSASSSKFLFNDGSSKKTVDLYNDKDAWYDGNTNTWIPKPVSPKPLFVHFKKPAGWAAAKIHYWNINPVGSYNATTWPGVSMTADAALGADWYTIDLSKASCSNIVFNDGTGKKTVDLNLCGEGWYDGAWSFDSEAASLQISPSGGEFASAQQVSLTATDNKDANPIIYYTLDGSNPTKGSSKFIKTGTVTITKSTTLKAFTSDQSQNTSGFYISNYKILKDTGAPVLSVYPESGTYSSAQYISMFAYDQYDGNPSLYYTLDGTTPTINSTKFNPSLQLIINSTKTLKVIAVDFSGNISAVVTRNYIIEGDFTAPVVTVTPGTGSYNSPQVVTLSATDDKFDSPVIYYTLDGSEPNYYSSSQFVKQGTITISTNTVLKVFAIDNNHNSSITETYTYVIQDIEIPTVSANPPGGAYSGPLTVTLSSNDNIDLSPVIYYTLNGTTPTTSSASFTKSGAINITSTTTIKFFAKDFSGNTTPVKTENYTLPSTGFNIYFKKPATWTNVKIYYWGITPANALPPITWPGASMLPAPEVGANWFVFNFNGVQNSKFLFTDGSGKQTADLYNDKTAYYDNGWVNKPENKPLLIRFKKPANWQSANIHYWNTEPAYVKTTWPGVTMTADAALGAGWYTLSLPNTLCANLVFNSGTGLQTGDLTACGEVWYNNGWTNGTGDVITDNTNSIVLGINDINESENLSVYPNPAAEQFTISYPVASEEQVTVRITNIFGAVVFYEETLVSDKYERLFARENLASGLYTVTVSDGKRIMRKKIVLKD